MRISGNLDVIWLSETDFNRLPFATMIHSLISRAYDWAGPLALSKTIHNAVMHA